MDIEHTIQQRYDAFAFSKLPLQEQDRLTRERRTMDELVARFKADLLSHLCENDINALYTRLSPTLSIFDNRFPLMTIDYYHAHFWLSYGTIEPDMWSIENVVLVRRIPKRTYGTTDRLVAPAEFGDTFLLTLGQIQADAPAVADKQRKDEQEHIRQEAAAKEKAWVDRLTAIEQQCREIDTYALAEHLNTIETFLNEQQAAVKKQRKMRRKMLESLLGS